MPHLAQSHRSPADRQVFGIPMRIFASVALATGHHRFSALGKQVTTALSGPWLVTWGPEEKSGASHSEEAPKREFVMNKLSWIVAVVLAVFAFYQQGNISELKNANAGLEKQVSDLKQTADAADKAVQDLKDKLAKAQATIEEAAAKPNPDELIAKITGLQKKLAASQADVINLKKKIDQLKAAQFETNSALAAAQQAATSASAFKDKNKALTDKVTALQEKLAAREQEALAARKQVEQAKAAQFDLNNQLKACKADRAAQQGTSAEGDDLKQQVQALKAQLEKVKKVRDALRDTLASAQTKVRETMAELDALKKKQTSGN